MVCLLSFDLGRWISISTRLILGPDAHVGGCSLHRSRVTRFCRHDTDVATPGDGRCGRRRLVLWLVNWVYDFVPQRGCLLNGSVPLAHYTVPLRYPMYTPVYGYHGVWHHTGSKVYKAPGTLIYIFIYNVVSMLF